MRTSRYAFSSVFTTSAVMLLVGCRVPRVTMRAYSRWIRPGVSGCSPATSLSEVDTRSTRRPGITRLGLLPSSTSRPSTSPCVANRSRTRVVIVEGARVDSKMITGTLPAGRSRRAAARPSSASNSGP